LHTFLALAAGLAVTVLLLLVLGLVVLMLAALSVLQSRGKHPIWFQLAQVAISPFGVLAGGLARLKAMGIL
jgi:vancomycin permeability regulator SanA